MKLKWPVAAQARSILSQKSNLTVHDAFAVTLNSIWREGGRQPRLGLAISGGVDSMALASLCFDITNRKSQSTGPLSAKDGYRQTSASFTAFIVNHKLRKGSSEEAEQVAAELATLDIPARILELDWRPFGDPLCLSNLESVARKLRYQVLGMACRESGIESLLLAHHANDQAETAMARIVTSYVGVGLAGMRFTAPIPECTGIYGVGQSGRPQTRGKYNAHNPHAIEIEGGGVTIARPLLQFRKEQLIEVCQKSGVRWFEDHTNADPTMTLRNTIRFMQKSNDLPTALQSPRLLDLAHRTERKRVHAEQEARQILDQMVLNLNLRTGEVRLAVPRTLEFPAVSKHACRASVLRQLLTLVTPKETISLQDLHSAVDLVFQDEDLRGRDSKNVAKRVQVAGVSIQRQTNIDNESEDRVYSFRRANPTMSERRDIRIKLCPAASSPKSKVDKVPEWRLWDGRFWLRVSPPESTSAFRNTEAVVRFLVDEDVANLRKDADERQRQVLDNRLALAKGSLRFTLPAIVVMRSADGWNTRHAREEVVALPSLNWSINGWKRGISELENSSWQWDIRYKHVELGRQNNHTVTS